MFLILILRELVTNFVSGHANLKKKKKKYFLFISPQTQEKQIKLKVKQNY